MGAGSVMTCRMISRTSRSRQRSSSPTPPATASRSRPARISSDAATSAGTGRALPRPARRRGLPRAPSSGGAARRCDGRTRTARCSRRGAGRWPGMSSPRAAPGAAGPRQPFRTPSMSARWPDSDQKRLPFPVGRWCHCSSERASCSVRASSQGQAAAGCSFRSQARRIPEEDPATAANHRGRSVRHFDHGGRDQGEAARARLRCRAIPVTGQQGAASGARRSQGAAHHRQVQPAAELGADLAGGADQFEAEPLVERDRAGIGGLDAAIMTCAPDSGAPSMSVRSSSAPRPLPGGPR